MDGEEFRAWRQRLGLTQADVAITLDVSQRTVAAWEASPTPINRQTQLATWAVERRVDLKNQLNLFLSGRMTTGEKRQHDGAWRDVDTTAESVERVKSHIAELDGLLESYRARQQRYGSAFDVGEPMMSTNGYCVTVRNAHKGPIASFEYDSTQAATLAYEGLKNALQSAVAVTDSKGKTW